MLSNLQIVGIGTVLISLSCMVGMMRSRNPQSQINWMFAGLFFSVAATIIGILT